MAAKKSKGTGRSERSEKVAETVAYKGRVGVEPGNVHRFEEIPVNVPEESVRRTLGNWRGRGPVDGKLSRGDQDLVDDVFPQRKENRSAIDPRPAADRYVSAGSAPAEKPAKKKQAPKGIITSGGSRISNADARKTGDKTSSATKTKPSSTHHRYSR
jgi:hypothetical protein